MYIYIDESGDLGTSSKYFVIGAIIINDSKKLDRIIFNTRKKYKKRLGNIPELKGSNLKSDIIKHILKKLNKLEFKVIIIVLD